jgi:hypothetical protein
MSTDVLFCLSALGRIAMAVNGVRPEEGSMSEQLFKTVLDRSGEPGSRRSLATISAMALAAAMNQTPVAAARKNGKNAKKKPRKRAGQRCQAQVADCQEFVVIGCSGRDDAGPCEAQAFPCCDFLSTCDATSMLDCIFVF